MLLVECGFPQNAYVAVESVYSFHRNDAGSVCFMEFKRKNHWVEDTYIDMILSVKLSIIQLHHSFLNFAFSTKKLWESCG